MSYMCTTSLTYISYVEVDSIYKRVSFYVLMRHPASELFVMRN